LRVIAVCSVKVKKILAKMHSKQYNITNRIELKVQDESQKWDTSVSYCVICERKNSWWISAKHRFLRSCIVEKRAPAPL